MARFFSKLGQERPSLGNLAKIAGLFVLPAALVARQPDLSTALTYMSILAVGIFVAGVKWRYVAVAGLAALLLLPIGWQYLEPYQRDRITAFLDPEQDPRGTGYQPIQSKIAVGSGEIWGKGFAQGSQTQLRFLPVPHTDFIFSAYAEETGFVGVVLALTLYFAMLMRIVHNAQTAADAAGMYICMGVAALLLFHVFVNISMVMGRMPVTGLPLPLMSYGGSSTITTFALLGLVNNVRLHRFTN
jgi:rod shape determining protein RodA